MPTKKVVPKKGMHMMKGGHMMKDSDMPMMKKKGKKMKGY